MSILISILRGFHVKILIRIQEGWLTELVMFFIGHYYIHYKTMFFLFNSVLYFPSNYHMVKEEKGD